MYRYAMVLVAILLLGSSPATLGCGGDDDGSSTPDAAPLADAVPVVPDATPATQCYPTGIYGKCTETSCPMCLSGANIYSVCSASCTESTQCGDASDFNGATPLCAPLNPGSMDKICVLTCTAQEQCPCGLDCRESGVQGVKICAETL